MVRNTSPTAVNAGAYAPQPTTHQTPVQSSDISGLYASLSGLQISPSWPAFPQTVVQQAPYHSAVVSNAAAMTAGMAIYPQRPVYYTTPDTQINSLNGVVETERKTLFVSDLDHSMEGRDITALLSAANSATYVKWRFAGKKPYGKVLATYSTPEGASYAMAYLKKQTTRGGRNISARFARESDTKTQTTDISSRDTGKDRAGASNRAKSGVSRLCKGNKDSNERGASPVIADGSKGQRS